MTPTQENQGLSTYYIQLWKKTYPHLEHNFNRGKANFGWKTMRLDYSLKEIKEIIDFHFSYTDRTNHDLHQFLWEYDQVIAKMRSAVRDREQRAKLMAQSEQRTKEFEERIARIKNDKRSPE